MSVLKKIINVLIISLILFSSCKKINYHKLKFEVTFIQDCYDCYGYDVITVGCIPKYSDDNIREIDTQNIYDGFVWSYEYWELVDGDKVSFAVLPINYGYHFLIKVYVDDKLVSFRECYGVNGNILIDQGGLNNSNGDIGHITFNFYENDIVFI